MDPSGNLPPPPAAAAPYGGVGVGAPAAASSVPAEQMQMLRQQQLQQQQQQQLQQFPMASSGLHYPQYMTQATDMNSAANLLAASRMGGSMMGGREDPSSSMLRYQSSRPDLSPAQPQASPMQHPGASPIQPNPAAVSTNQPAFVFDGYAGWVCRHCSHLDHYYRGPNYVWMGSNQPPPQHFIDAHVRMCPALNQPSTFGAAAAAAANTNFLGAASPTQPQMPVLQGGGGGQPPVQQAQPKQQPTQQPLSSGSAAEEKGADKGGDGVETSRKRKYEAPDPPSEEVPSQALAMNHPTMNNMPQVATAAAAGGEALWPRQNFPPMFSQLQPGMGMPQQPGMTGMPHPAARGIQPGMMPPGMGGMPPGMYPSALDPSTGMRHSVQPHPMMMHGAMGGMPPPHAASRRIPGVVHQSSHYLPGHFKDVMHDFTPHKKKTSHKKNKPQPSPKGVQSTDDEYAKALAFLRKRADETPLLPSAPADVKLIEEGDSNLLTDYFYFIMQQLAVCRLSEQDRKTRGGKRQDVAVGYGGLQCIHCAPAPSSRKFFWSNVDRLANSFAGIPDHVLTCKLCPEEVTEALLVLKGRHNAQMTLLPRGTQKQFFRRMWRRLHAGDESAKAAATGVGTRDNVAKSPNDAAADALKRAVTLSSVEKQEERVLLAVPQDKNNLSDLDCFLRKQIEVFCANNSDIRDAMEYVPVKPGQVGLRCLHCAKSGEGARGDAVQYPHSVSGIFQAVGELNRLHLHDCPNLAPELKSAMTAMTADASLSSVHQRYYVQAAGALGLFDSDEGGIRAGGRVIPL
jgi:hypothetical protein